MIIEYKVGQLATYVAATGYVTLQRFLASGESKLERQLRNCLTLYSTNVAWNPAWWKWI